VEVTLDRLEMVFPMPTRPVDGLIRLRRRGGRQGGDHKAGVVASGPHLGFEDAPPWLGPGRRRRGTLGIQAAAVWRVGVMGLCKGRRLLVQMACCLEDGFGGAEQDRMACEAEDESDERPRRASLDHLRGGAMAVAADPDRGLGPVATQNGQEPDQDHRLLRTGGPCARAKAGGHPRAGEPCKDQERQIAIVLVIMIIERELLLSVGRIVCMIEVEHDGRRRLRVAGDAVGAQRPGEPIEVLTIHTVCKPREGWRTRQVLLGSQGRTLTPQLKQWIATAAVGSMAVGIAGGNVIATLGQEVAEWMSNVGGMAGIVDGGRQACGEANLAIDATE